MRDSIVFYRSFAESFAELSDEDRLTMYDAVLKYGLDGEEPELTGLKAALFKLVKPQIDANTRRYENGLKGGRKPNQNQTETKSNQTVTKRNQTKPNLTKVEPNVNDNDNVNGNGNGNASGSDDVSSLISFLNSETGSHYKDTEQIRTLIEKKLDEGYSVENIRTVIRNKSLEWSCDAKMRSYLRPSTLFGDKFDEYLNAPEPKEIEEERFESDRKEKLQIELEQYTNSLAEVNEQINLIQGEGVDDSNRDRLTQLRFDAAHYEDVINNLVRRMEKSG